MSGVRIPELKEDIQNNKAHFKRVNNKIKRKTQARQHELKKIDKHYDKKVQNARQEGLKDIYRTKRSKNKEVEEIIKNKEERINNYYKDLNKTKAKIENQKNRIENFQEKKIEDLKARFQHENDFKLKQAKFKSKGIDSKTQRAIQDINFKTEQQINKHETNANDRVNNLLNRHEDLIANAKNQHLSQLRKNRLEYKQKLADERLQHQNKLEKLKIQTRQKEQAQKEKISGNKKQREENYRKKLKTQDKRFQENFHQLKEKQASVISRAKENFQERIQDLVDSFKQKKKFIEKKSSDDFYQMTVLDPIVQDKGDHYILSMNVPEHEKDEITVSAHKRKIKINFAREYSQELRSKDGNHVDKSRRTELFVKEFPTSEIIDSTDIERSYQDNKLMFKIGKA